MRLRRLDLTRYGKFTDHVIDFGAVEPGAPDLHIVYGLNEAGKSTSLSAYLDLLYGIEERSRYNFLHAYNAMQVGGCLEFAGASHDLKRVKQRAGSLLDGRGEAVPEALLSVPLAGISRDAYRTMFSLDDVTLEEGGNAILQSKGDLGELLFSASAGLAGVSTTLGAISDEADTLYKKRARSTRIAELKQKLAELKARRDEIDTLASTHAGLVAALSQAEAAYDEAMHARGNARARSEAITRLLRARPLAAEYRRLEAELAENAGHRRPPADWARDLPGLMEEETRLATRLAGIEADMERLRQEIEGSELDEPVLALSDRITHLARGLARFAGAEEDLPKRRIALAARNATIDGILTRLDRTGCETPADLLLPAATVGALRDLIEMRSGVEARLQTAARELAAAKAAKERVDSEHEALVARGEHADPSMISRLTATLAIVRRSDHSTRLRLAERSLGDLERRFAEAVRPLAEFADSDLLEGEALRIPALPDPRQLEIWRAALAAVDSRIADHTERRRQLVTQHTQAEARIAALGARGGLVEDTEIVRLRAQRDAAWKDHLQRLDKESAEAFEKAMHADDLGTTARISAMRDLADLRTLTEERTVAATGIDRQEELLDEAKSERERLLSELRDTLPKFLPVSADGNLARLFSLIEQLVRARSDAQSAWERLEGTRHEIATARADAELDRDTLATALDAAGIERTGETLPELLEVAEAAVTAGNGRAAARTAAEKAIADHKRALDDRRREFEEAGRDRDDWQARFSATLAETWFGEIASTGAVREILETLTELAPALNDRDELARRIATMEKDQADFVAEVQDILSNLGETADPASASRTAVTLAARLEKARHDQSLRSDKIAALDRLAETQRKLRQDLAEHAARKSELTSFFGVDTLAEVSLALETANERARRETRLAALREQILAELHAATIEAALADVEASDFDAMEQEQAELAARLDDLDERARQLFAERTRAGDRLDAVGGDDQVARIEAERRTILLEIEEHAASYLRLKSGVLIAGEALRAYRDKHRSSMMKRASEAFRLITRGDYTGLATQPDKDRETLIGLSRQGGSKLASEMSKGTQFQLYLALRLAGYEEFAASRPSVPFIADDIMETFDEPRSEEVLRLFGEMAKIGQVIYLTHHRHLCDIARRVVPEVRIHEIAS